MSYNLRLSGPEVDAVLAALNATASNIATQVNQQNADIEKQRLDAERRAAKAAERRAQKGNK